MPEIPDTHRDITCCGVVHFTGFEGKEYNLPKKVDEFLSETAVTVEDGELHIQNPEGIMVAKPGDYLVKDQHGNIWPMEPHLIKEWVEDVKQGDGVKA